MFTNIQIKCEMNSLFVSIIVVLNSIYSLILILCHIILSLNTQPMFIISMNKRKFKQKLPLGFDAILSEQIKYPLLYFSDSLYPQTLHLLKSNEFKGFIHNIVRQLTPLLLLNQPQFFTLLGKNLSIRTSLESCLSTFPRRAYSRFIDQRQLKKDLSKINDESYKEYAFLMKIVLFIFYRISSASDEQDKQLVYNEFLLDIPKLLDIVAIYGESNPIIVSKLIQNAYAIHPSYDADTMDFFNYVEHGKLQQMQRNKDTDIDFSPQSLNAQNYGNRQKYMIQKVLLTMFTVKDTLFNLTNFLKFFPKRYVYELATDYKLQQRLIDGVTFFTNQMNYGWNLGEYKQKYFTLLFEDMRQSLVVYFIQEFKILKEIIQNNTEAIKQFQEYAHMTYQTFCLLLQSKKKPYFKEYVKLIHNLIEESQERIFFLDAADIYKFSNKNKSGKTNKTQSAIQYCQKYQQDYRKKHKIARSVDFDSILNKNRQNLKKFKEIWISETEQKRKAIAKERQKKYRKIQDHQLNSYINSLKYGGKSKEYDDEPEEQQFNNVVLTKQYDKLDKVELNLSFSMEKKKIKYVPKDSIISSKIHKQNQLNNLSFSRSTKQNILKNSLSFIQANEEKCQMPSLDISMIQQNQGQQIMHNQELQALRNLDIVGLSENQVFNWDSEIDNELKDFQQYLQKSNSKVNVPLQDLSF